MSQKRRRRAGSASRQIRCNAFAYNVLGSHHTDARGKNASMLDGPTRMKYSIKLWNSHRLDLGGLSELEDAQANVIADRKHWNVVRANPNGGRHTGFITTGLAYRTSYWNGWEVVDFEKHRFPYGGRGRGLNFITLMMRHRRTGAILGVMPFQSPRLGGLEAKHHPHEMQVIIEQFGAAFVNACYKEGFPALCLGDSNHHESFDRTPSFDTRIKVYARLAVDVIAGLGFIIKDTLTLDKSAGVRGTLSDHGLVAIEARIPVCKGPFLFPKAKDYAGN